MSDLEAMEVANTPLPDESVVAETSESTSEEVNTKSETPETDDGTKDASAEANDEPSPTKETEEEAPKETKSKRQRRMRREREQSVRADLDRAEQANARLQKQLEDTKAPKYEDFVNPDDYTAKLAAHSATEAILNSDAARARGTIVEAQAQVNAEYTQAVKDVTDEGQATHKDFTKVISHKDLQLSQDMVNASLETENSSDVLYFLGKNPDESERISRLNPIAQAMEVGRLSANLSSKIQKQTKANPPIKTLKGTSISAEKNPENMSNDEYRKWRNNGQG